MESFQWDEEEKRIFCKAMKPMPFAEKDEPPVWKDSYARKYKWDIFQNFSECTDGPALAAADCLKLPADGTEEMWFRAIEWRSIRGSLEMDLLYMMQNLIADSVNF